jgi:glutamate 5-kinase
MHRASLKDASRIVVKLGTGILTDGRTGWRRRFTA